MISKASSCHSGEHPCARTSFGDGLPQVSSHPIGLGRRQCIGHHHPLHHVGDDGPCRTPHESHRHHGMVIALAPH